MAPRCPGGFGGEKRRREQTWSMAGSSFSDWCLVLEGFESDQEHSPCMPQMRYSRFFQDLLASVLVDKQACGAGRIKA
jgi:hypothetical protein